MVKNESKDWPQKHTNTGHAKVNRVQNGRPNVLIFQRKVGGGREKTTAIVRFYKYKYVFVKDKDSKMEVIIYTHIIVFVPIKI